MPRSARILVLNGPNLNMLGQREPEIYGRQTLDEIGAACAERAAALGLEVDFRQSNSEGEIIEWIQSAAENCHGIIINPAAFTHTSVALRDAMLASGIPFIEVHLSNVHAREPFRHHSYFSDIAEGVICGLGSQGYDLALKAALQRIHR